ncbi:hypothetical protein PMAYCL1PPCAC_25470, partial [Pristionchus mayeri]
NKITAEFHIRLINPEGPKADPGIFAVPSHISNVILKIGDKKLHVTKEILANHSPVFTAMFFWNFAENGKEEVEIKDVVYEEFLDLLHLVYSRTMKLNDYTVPHILKLADRFQMDSLLKESENHLKQSTGIDVVEKLLMADHYRLKSLR